MPKKVAVEDNLTDVATALKDKGYQVVSLKGGQKYDVAVVTGMDKDLMSIQTTSTKAPVLDASGMTANEIVSKIENMLH